MPSLCIVVSRSLTVLALVGLLAPVGCASRARATGGTVTALDGQRSSASAPEGLKVRVGQDVNAIYFGFDSSQLTADASRDLGRVAERLRSDPALTVRFEGNCDDRGTTEYNLALGEVRADAARRHLVRQGIDVRRITTLSYCKERPRVKGGSEVAWGQNRRDDVVYQGPTGTR